MTPEQIAAIVAAAVAEAMATQQPTTVAEAVAEGSAPKRKPGRPKGSKNRPKDDAKTYTWRPWACARFAIPAKVGETFAYESKRSGTSNVHRVTAVAKDGTVTSVRA